MAATGDQLLGEDSIEGSLQSADDQSGATGSTEHKEEGEPAPDEENDGNVTEEEQSENEAIDSSTSDVVEPIENNEEKEADSAPKNKSEIDMCILRSPAFADAFSIGRYAEHNGRLNRVTARSLVELQPCNAWSLVS